MIDRYREHLCQELKLPAPAYPARGGTGHVPAKLKAQSDPQDFFKGGNNGIRDH